MNEPHWKGRGIAAAAIGRKSAVRCEPTVKSRDYIGEAAKVVGTTIGTSIIQAPQELLAAVIIAQAVDRLGERIIEAAALSSYKRT